MKTWFFYLIGILTLISGCAGISPIKVNEEFANELAFRKNAYHLKPEDVISITVLGQTDFNEAEIMVTRDGYIDTLLGRFFVLGKTVPEVEDIIKKEQKEFINNIPRIIVRIRTMAPETVWVGGQVRSPGAVVLLPDMTAAEAVLQVGGELPTADTNSVCLIRRTSNWQRTVKVVNMELMEEDLVLLPHDIIYVPRHTAAEIANFLDQYFYQLLPISYLSQARYFTPTGTMGF